MAGTFYANATLVIGAGACIVDFVNYQGWT